MPRRSTCFCLVDALFPVTMQIDTTHAECPEPSRWRAVRYRPGTRILALMPRRLVLLLALVLLAVGCGEDPADPGPFPDGALASTASSNLAVGTERVLVAVYDVDGARLASPEVPVSVSVRPEDGDPGEPVEAAFTWAVPEVSGVYRATVEFTRPGIWMVRVTPEGGRPLEEFPVMVLPEPLTPGVGAPAPRSDTPTAADAPLEEISSDHHPDPRFYQMSVAEAVTSGRPSVIVFATPAFCTTAVCGPTLDMVKEMADEYPDVNFVHVEVYANLADPDNLELVPAVLEWGLPTEPWVFVVDADGNVSARFEGVVDAEEIAEALALAVA